MLQKILSTSKELTQIKWNINGFHVYSRQKTNFLQHPFHMEPRPSTLILQKITDRLAPSETFITQAWSRPMNYKKNPKC